MRQVSVLSPSPNMDLQTYLIEKFKKWQPPEPEVVARTKGSITLNYKQGDPFGFLADQLLYRVEKNEKLPKWIVVYSGGQSTKLIDYLAPRHPHKFRVKVILKASAVPQLAKMALEYYGDEATVYKNTGKISDELEDNKTDKINEKLEQNVDAGKVNVIDEDRKVCDDTQSETDNSNSDPKIEDQQAKAGIKNVVDAVKLISELNKVKVYDSGDQANSSCQKPAWIESQWSEEAWTSTDSDGTSAGSFCMAVKCGHLKLVQVLADERPDLIGIVNPSTGLTPLATAVKKGDINTVRFLLTLGAEVDQPSLAGQTPLHFAVLAAGVPVVELLMEKGADVKARDWNGLRMEHYAVDSCDLDMLKYILDKGGDIAAKDYNGWSPLFRALCQGAATAVVEELVSRGSNVHEVDNAGLPLTSVARLLKNRHGRSRDSIMRLVDTQYPHEQALANFTRLTKKIYNVHSLLKM